MKRICQRVNRAHGVAPLKGKRLGWQGVLMIRRRLGSPCGCAGMMAACGACRSAAARRCGIAVGSRPCRSDGLWSVIQAPSIRHGLTSRRAQATRQHRDVVHQALEHRDDVRGKPCSLGFETQRQWSDLAIERMTPCLGFVFATRWLTPCIWKVAWRFARVLGMPNSATLWQRCGNICGRSTYFSTSATATGWNPRLYLHRLMQSACYTH